MGMSDKINLRLKVLSIILKCLLFRDTSIRALRWGGFRSTKKSTSTELEKKYKAPSLHVTPPDAKPILAIRSFSSQLVHHFYGVFNILIIVLIECSNSVSVYGRL